MCIRDSHGAGYQDYVKLHAAMTREGFSNQIRASDGVYYQLPPAEYDLTGNYTLNLARDKASRAAQQTLKKFAIVVSEYSSAAWAGLNRV